MVTSPTENPEGPPDCNHRQRQKIMETPFQGLPLTKQAIRRHHIAMVESIRNGEWQLEAVGLRSTGDVDQNAINECFGACVGADDGEV